MEAKRVVHVDADTLMREAFKLALEQGYNVEGSDVFQVVHSVSNGKEALEICAKEEVDLILLDVALPDMSGYSIAQELLKKNKEQKIIVLSMHTTLDHMNRSINAGISGHLSKNNSIEAVKKVMREVLEGHTFFESNALMTIFNENKKKYSDKLLTPLEIKVMELIYQQKSVRQISNVLNCSTKTVTRHINALEQKLGVKSRIGLALYAERHKLF